jgi:hypothetical protein
MAECDAYFGTQYCQSPSTAGSQNGNSSRFWGWLARKASNTITSLLRYTSDSTLVAAWGHIVAHIQVTASTCAIIACLNLSFQDWNLKLAISAGVNPGSYKNPGGNLNAWRNLMDPDSENPDITEFGGLSVDWNSALPSQQQTPLFWASGAKEFVGANGGVGLRTNNDGFYWFVGYTAGDGVTFQGPEILDVGVSPQGFFWGMGGGTATGGPAW